MSAKRGALRTDRFKSGAFVLAIQTGRAVVPARIRGGDAVLPRGRRVGSSVSAPRWRSFAAIAGPAAFIAAWSRLGATRLGYSPMHDPISQLAAVDASTRPAMTAGFVAFAAGVGVFSSVLRDNNLSGAGRAATLTAVATLGIAALPLGGPGGDQPHAVAAGVAYAALAGTPLLAARPLVQRGAYRAAAASTAAGIAVAGALAASAVLPRYVGVAQRVGLTVGDLWIMISAGQILRASGARPSRHADRSSTSTRGRSRRR